MRTVFKLALLVVPALALSQERSLPDDVFFGGVSSVLAIKQTTPNTYEFSQIGALQGAPPGNAATLCGGAALAHMKGYSGMSVGMIDDGQPSGTKKTLTVALLTAPGEEASLPTNLRWLPYFDIKTLRDRCSQFVSAKYLWPAK